MENKMDLTSRLQTSRRPHIIKPWHEGRFVVWDITVADTTAASYLAATATVAGSAAKSVKKRYYIELYQIVTTSFLLLSNHIWTIKQQSRIIFIRPGSTYYIVYVRRQGNKFFFQRISVTLQRFKAICASDTLRDLLINDSGC